MKKMLGLFALAGTLVARGADPYVGYIYPAGIQAGTTNRLIVGGQFFGNIKGALAGEGVKVLDVEFVPNFPPPVGEQRRWMVKWLDQIALKGDFTQPRLPVESEHFSDWRSNRWYFVLGDLDLGKRTLVEHFLPVPCRLTAYAYAFDVLRLRHIHVKARVTRQPFLQHLRRHLVSYFASGREVGVRTEVAVRDSD